MKTEDIVEILKHGEGQRTEFKKSFSATNEAIQSLSAFANQDGGTVILGSDDEGKTTGVDIGRNTIENFANSITSNTDPSLAPTIEEFEIADRKIVAATIEWIGDGQVSFAYGRAKIRVGKTNQSMTPDLQRSRLQSRSEKWSEQRDIPRFKVTQQGVSRLETAFKPILKIEHTTGDPVATLEWRFRGPLFQGDWNVADGHSLESTNVSGVFDLTELPIDDEHVNQDEPGIEIRFHWRDQWRHEIHRWPIKRREFPTKVLWDVGRQLIPTLYFNINDPSTADENGPSTKQNTVIDHARTSSRERGLDGLLKLASLELSGNIKSTGFSASELSTATLEELQQHSEYPSLPNDLLTDVDMVFRAASTQNAIGRTVLRSSAAANHSSYIKIANKVVDTITDHLESIGRLKCRFSPVEVSSHPMSREWVIEITNEDDNPVVDCFVQLDDLWFDDLGGDQTLDRFPTSIPLRWIGPSNSSHAAITANGKRKYELLAAKGEQVGGKIEIAYDESDRFRQDQSLSVDDIFFMQLSITSANSKPEFIVIKVDPPIVRNLILRGLNERDAIHRPPIEIVYQGMYRTPREFSVSSE